MTKSTPCNEHLAAFSELSNYVIASSNHWPPQPIKDNLKTSTQRARARRNIHSVRQWGCEDDRNLIIRYKRNRYKTKTYLTQKQTRLWRHDGKVLNRSKLKKLQHQTSDTLNISRTTREAQNPQCESWRFLRMEKDRLIRNKHQIKLTKKQKGTRLAKVHGLHSRSYFKNLNVEHFTSVLHQT